MDEWSEDHVMAIGSLNSNLGLVGRIWLNWRPGGALRFKGETVDWDGQGSGMWKAGVFKAVAPHLCRLRTYELAPVSKF
jgi:hypothetical protein